MKTRIGLLITVALIASGLEAQSPQGSAGSVPQAGPRAAEVERIIEAHYIRQFTLEIQPTDEQWNKLLPEIQSFIQKRIQNAVQKQRAQAALERASESEQRQLIETIDKASAQTNNIDRMFRNNVDPILTVRQQAKLRQLDNNIWPRIQEMINQAREQAQERQEEQRLRRERQTLRGQRQTQPNKALGQPQRSVK